MRPGLGDMVTGLLIARRPAASPNLDEAQKRIYGAFANGSELGGKAFFGCRNSTNPSNAEKLISKPASWVELKENSRSHYYSPQTCAESVRDPVFCFSICLASVTSDFRSATAQHAR